MNNSSIMEMLHWNTIEDDLANDIHSTRELNYYIYMTPRKSFFVNSQTTRNWFPQLFHSTIRISHWLNILQVIPFLQRV